jgi:3-keto-5-aminohexanoate cleavage enzyme
MVAGLAVNILPLAGMAARRGGNVRVGLEDAPLGSARTNLEWVRAARQAIEGAGSSLASAKEVRRALSGY